MKKYQIAEVTKEENNAGTKANKDVTQIADGLGYERVSIHTVNSDPTLLAKVQRQLAYIRDWLRVSKTIENDSIILLQHPFHFVEIGREPVLKYLKEKKNCSFICFVHDVEFLRGFRFNDYYDREFKNMLYLSDVLVVHNNVMADYFIKEGIPAEKIVVLGIFDYLSDETTKKKKKYENSITVAGNLDTQKCAYIHQLGMVDPVKVNLYGSNYDESMNEYKNVTYHGSFPPNVIPEKLDRGYGLVWDGESIDGLQGMAGEYIKYNNPHKLSLFISSGLPVVIPDEAAEKEFVESNHVGIVVKSLKDLNDILKGISKKEYDIMSENCYKLAEKMNRGYFAIAALQKAERIID